MRRRIEIENRLDRRQRQQIDLLRVNRKRQYFDVPETVVELPPTASRRPLRPRVDLVTKVTTEMPTTTISTTTSFEEKLEALRATNEFNLEEYLEFLQWRNTSSTTSSKNHKKCLKITKF